jgi:hypothetical protein
MEEDNKMKKLLIGTIFLALIIVIPISMAIGADIRIRIPLPPPLIIPAPPPMVVIPGTYVYFPPDLDEEVFFYHGYWYRPYRGYWYWSRGYDGPWGYYGRRPPRPLLNLPPRYREDYRERRMEHSHIPHHELQQNWGRWERERHWDRRRDERRRERPPEKHDKRR